MAAIVTTLPANWTWEPETKPTFGELCQAYTDAIADGDWEEAKAILETARRLYPA